MTVDDQFRAALDNLASRLNRDTARHVDSAAEELTATAERVAAATAAAHQEALALAAQGARMDAERTTTERVTLAIGTAHAAALARAVDEARAETERSTAAHLTATLMAEHAEALGRTSREVREETERAATERATLALGTAHAVALARAVDEARAETERSTTARLTAALAETERRTRTAVDTTDIEAGERLVRAFRAIDAGRSLSDMLNSLVLAVSSEASRVALFLTQDARFRSLRLVGFELPSLSSDPLYLSIQDAAMIAVAAQTRWCVTTAAGGAFRPPPFADLPEERLAVAAPLIVNDEVAGVMYADQGAAGDARRKSWPATIEAITCHAARGLEALTARRLANTLAMRAGVQRPAPEAFDSAVNQMNEAR